ncbi:hypothetical protein C8D88_104314 [Lentzea atacamensis]|uniref:Uncharacterized protein n=1 Tax=Lentzea atacamensis TaxID=531938 RepID=A0A316I288_9PSEU|nr:hypothetical protein C8D88_104314 [Lentzea atacamensis]
MPSLAAAAWLFPPSGFRPRMTSSWPTTEAMVAVFASSSWSPVRR